MSVGIIGTAGRSNDYLWFTKEKYDRVVEIIDRSLTDVCSKTGMRTEDLCLFSGGAAFMDHVAVKLFLTGKYGKLILFLPAFYDMKIKRYIETIIEGENSGKKSNHYHDLMRSVTGYNSLSEIHTAFGKGAAFQYYSTFKKRNSGLAQFANRVNATVYAFTLAPGLVPKDGGTHDTWTKLKCAKYHTSLTLFDTPPSLQKQSEDDSIGTEGKISLNH